MNECFDAEVTNSRDPPCRDSRPNLHILLFHHHHHYRLIRRHRQRGPFLSYPIPGEAGEGSTTTRTTILDLLRENMDGLDLRRRKSLKERLGFVGGCCGPIWDVQPTVVDDDDDEEGGGDVEIHHHHPPQDQRLQRGEAPYPGCGVAGYDVRPGMNLAAAMAAERQYRAVQEREWEVLAPGTSPRVSLMKLLEEAEEVGGAAGNDSGCCVCMVRKKGSAFIACGHTFCRVCSREIWLNRGRCPLCNRPILDVLDIF